MLDIKARIKIINSLLDQDTAASLTYAALECRLTLEYLCYERFKQHLDYLSAHDLKNWQPRHIVKQVAEEINEFIASQLSISISKIPETQKTPPTTEDLESLEYTPLGVQSELKLRDIHKLWSGLSNIALHIPVPHIGANKLSIYGDKKSIKEKVEDVIKFLSEIQGNLLFGGFLGKSFNFQCVSCNTTIKKPVNNIKRTIVASCINPRCHESYLLKNETSEEIEIIRRVIKFECPNCKESIDIPTRVFHDLKFEQILKVECFSCKSDVSVIMHPRVKVDLIT